jgi:maltose alpha-D-glucosyltransferase / alpha-amylase
VLAQEAKLLMSFESLRSARFDAKKIRTHGHLHLGHVLYTGRDFTFTGFGGQPGFSLAERRRKRSPLRDLAWITCSYHHLAMKLLLDPARVRETDVEIARPWALSWATWVSASLVDAYTRAMDGASLVPTDRGDLAILFDAFVLERTLHELRAALEDGNLEEVAIPLLAIAQHLR